MCFSANYLYWRSVMDLAAHGPQELEDIEFKFASVLYGTSQKPPRLVQSSIALDLAFLVELSCS